MSLQKYCCTGLGTKDTICGNAKRKGGIKHGFWIKEDQTSITDWTSEVQWLAAIAAGDVVLLSEIRGEFPEPSEQETDTLIGCGPETELDGFDFEFLWQDRAVNPANNDFYQDMNECPAHFGWYDCQPGGTARIHIVNIGGKFVSFVCKPTTIEASLNTVQRYPCKAKWSGMTFPTIYNAPPNIFS